MTRAETGNYFFVWPNARCYKKYNLTIIIPTDHHIGYQDGGHFEPIFINISVRLQDSIDGPQL